LHPVVVYFKNENTELEHKNYIFVSDDLGHNIGSVYAWQNPSERWHFQSVNVPSDYLKPDIEVELLIHVLENHELEPAILK
jgi:hypothetical protein